MKNITIIFAILFINGCIKTKPRELKSPCVAIESDNLIDISPCSRRPANSSLIS